MCGTAKIHYNFGCYQLMFIFLNINYFNLTIDVSIEYKRIEYLCPKWKVLSGMMLGSMPHHRIYDKGTTSLLHLNFHTIVFIW